MPGLIVLGEGDMESPRWPSIWARDSLILVDWPLASLHFFFKEEVALGLSIFARCLKAQRPVVTVPGADEYWIDNYPGRSHSWKGCDSHPKKRSCKAMVISDLYDLPCLHCVV